MGCGRDHVSVSRRGFLGRAAGGVLGGMTLPRVVMGAGRGDAAGEGSRVALTHGDSRAEIVFNALKLIEPQIREGLARKKTVVIKPNLVSTTKQLAATHVECLEGICEFLKGMVKEEIVLAESPAAGSLAEGASNFGYERLRKRYNVKFVDLDFEPFAIKHLVTAGYRPIPLRMSKLLLDPDVYVISAAVLKTHDRAVATLSLKNIVVGAPIKDPGFHWGRGSKGKTDKPLVHGGRRNEGIHYNMFKLAKELSPDLSVIDGFQGMEGNGPVSGTPVDHRVAVASTDWLAADRTGIELMGFDFAKVGYLSFCARAGMGQADPGKIQLVGEKLSDYIRKYRPHDNIEKQYKWIVGSG